MFLCQHGYIYIYIHRYYIYIDIIYIYRYYIYRYYIYMWRFPVSMYWCGNDGNWTGHGHLTHHPIGGKTMWACWFSYHERRLLVWRNHLSWKRKFAKDGGFPKSWGFAIQSSLKPVTTGTAKTMAGPGPNEPSKLQCPRVSTLCIAVSTRVESWKWGNESC